ncbi:putative Sin3 binding protein-domain-containing protein [Morchella snyderi]|nr:putative Sin3 binding protein-domain-containing protein [Morchella snyderi]
MATSTTVSIPAAITISNLSSRLRRGGDATVSSNNAFPHPDHVDAKYHLPTPPTSISPSLAPVHKFKQSCNVGDRQGVTDSDVDVSDIGVGGVSKLPTTESHNLGPQLSEAAGAITPALLAKYHLPGILLQHGPLAIRHVTAHLITNIPGFSTIPPAKQRRLVVGALEGRGGVSGSEGEAGGVNGDVIFEKVGWGRWDARLKDDLPRDREGTSSRGLSPATSVLSTSVSTYGAKSNGIYTGESGIFVQSEEEASDLSEDPDTMERDENEADMMSLDEHPSEEEDADMTDEEDWAQMGAAMLRRQAGSPITSDGFLSGSNGYDDSAAALRAREEREAVEALVRLSSI